LKREIKYSNLLEMLIAKIKSGDYKPGKRLPGQMALAKECGVSAITSERALSELEKLGYIERRKRSGSFVLEKPRVFSEIFIVADIIPEERIWLSEYYMGISSRTTEIGAPCQIIMKSDPHFEERVLVPGRHGVILLGFDDLDTVKRLEDCNIPHVVAAHQARYAKYCVTENRRAAARELAFKLHSKACDKIAFFYNPKQPNHCLAKEGCEDALEELRLDAFICECKEEDARATASKFLEKNKGINGFLVTGGGLPLAILPLVLTKIKDPVIGLITENPSILQFKDIAFIAHYSQYETGVMAFEMLYDVASGRLDRATTSHPPLEIISPACI
jgi:DNA-binding LacI/PurR family transcriptional regulator